MAARWRRTAGKIRVGCLAIGVVILSVRKAPLRVVKSAVKRSIKLMPGPVLALAFAPRGASGSAWEVESASKAPMKALTIAPAERHERIVQQRRAVGPVGGCGVEESVEQGAHGGWLDIAGDHDDARALIAVGPARQLHHRM